MPAGRRRSLPLCGAILGLDRQRTELRDRANRRRAGPVQPTGIETGTAERRRVIPALSTCAISPRRVPSSGCATRPSACCPDGGRRAVPRVADAQGAGFGRHVEGHHPTVRAPDQLIDADLHGPPAGRPTGAPGTSGLIRPRIGDLLFPVRQGQALQVEDDSHPRPRAHWPLSWGDQCSEPVADCGIASTSISKIQPEPLRWPVWTHAVDQPANVRRRLCLRQRPRCSGTAEAGAPTRPATAPARCDRSGRGP